MIVKFDHFSPFSLSFGWVEKIEKGIKARNKWEKTRARHTEQALRASETDCQPFIQIKSVLNHMYVSTLKIARLFGDWTSIRELFLSLIIFFLQMSIEWKCVYAYQIVYVAKEKPQFIEKTHQIYRKKGESMWERVFMCVICMYV